MDMKRQFHYIFFACTIALTVICGILMTRVNVNADMTKYLPDDSQMKRGLDIVSSVFGDAAQVSGSDVHIMFDSISPAEISGMCTLLKAYPDVNDVTYRYSADSAHTVFDLAVPKTINQKALGKQIAKRFGGNCVVETSQDGATPPISVMIIAAVLVMIVLFLMAQSWFEPVVILLTMGIAVVLNMGTNALLPSVSITTNFIGSILQAVLSLDYCIILLNRYRQEQNEHTDRQTAVFAANRAVKKAAPSVLSSALTTIVGLLMLCFMRLKIGADMGIVLAKGVACSLICTFTVMPSLMLLFRRVINKTAKPVYVPSTDKLARFVTSHKIPMMIGAVMLFFASWYFSQRTTIFFSANAESKIEEVFPLPNPMLVIYDTQDEASIPALADSLMALPSVQTIISYPTLLGQQLTPAEMTNHIASLATLMADQMPEGVSLASPEVKAILTPEMMQIAYFMRATHGQEQKMTFPDLARFMHSHISSNPLFASYLDDDMRKQIALLQSMLDMPAASSEPTEPIVSASAEQSFNPNSLNANSLNPNSLNDTSHIPHPTSDTVHPTPYTVHPTPDTLHPTSNIQHQTSNIQHQTSDIQHPTSNILHQTSNIQHPTSDIQHPTSDIVHPTSADLQAELFIELVFGGKEYTPAQMASKLSRLMKLSGVKSAPVTADQMSLLYTYYGSVHSACDTMRLGLDQLLTYVCDTLIYDTRLADMVPNNAREQVAGVKKQVIGGMGQLRQPSHSLFVVLTSLPVESAQTYAFVDTLMSKADAQLVHDHYYLGESVMYSEMKAGFGHEMNVVTLLTVLAIFLIVALTFRSLIVPTILVVTVMTAFYVNVVMAGLISGQVLYLAYLIVQAILMGATIDYGILFANYYRENRKTMPQYEAVSAAYRGSIRTILTSGIIMVIAPGVMAALIDDLMISNIVRSLAIGAFMAVLLILTVVPAVLVALDRLVVYGKKNRFSASAEEFETEEVVDSEKSEEKASSTEVSKSATK